MAIAVPLSLVSDGCQMPQRALFSWLRLTFQKYQNHPQELRVSSFEVSVLKVLLPRHPWRAASSWLQRKVEGQPEN